MVVNVQQFPGMWKILKSRCGSADGYWEYYKWETEVLRRLGMTKKICFKLIREKRLRESNTHCVYWRQEKWGRAAGDLAWQVIANRGTSTINRGYK